jgi:hypothetical protein
VYAVVGPFPLLSFKSEKRKSWPSESDSFDSSRCYDRKRSPRVLSLEWFRYPRSRSPDASRSAFENEKTNISCLVGRAIHSLDASDSV